MTRKQIIKFLLSQDWILDKDKNLRKECNGRLYRYELSECCIFLQRRLGDTTQDDIHWQLIGTGEYSKCFIAEYDKDDHELKLRR